MTIERAILTALGRIPPTMMLPEATLAAEVGLILGHPPLPSRIQVGLASLDGSKEIVGIENREVKMKWKITDLGRATLAES